MSQGILVVWGHFKCLETIIPQVCAHLAGIGPQFTGVFLDSIDYSWFKIINDTIVNKIMLNKIKNIISCKQVTRTRIND
jgi:hypothetical protein